MRKAVLMLAIVTSSIITGSCTVVETRYLAQPLPLPARPVLPPVTPEELGAIPATTAEKIVQRDRLRRQYAEQLETIIKATHQEKNDGR